MAKTIGQQAIDLFRKYGKKSEVARELLDQGYSVSEISKAVPMAYSQVHSINQKRTVGQFPAAAKAKQVGPPKAKPAERMDETVVRLATDDPRFQTVQARNADRRRLAKEATDRQTKLKAQTGKSKVGRLRTPGPPSDQPVGECANCGYDLVVRPTSTGFVIIHTGVSAEEYLATVQFCTAVPRSLLA